MNVLQNLTVLYNHLSPDSTYRNVCSKILENLEEASKGTIYDLAELTHSSRTTIWRMMQKLGYESFTEFHHDLKRAVENYTYYNRILPQEKCDSSDSIKQSLLEQMHSAYENLQRSLDTKELEIVAETLHNADSVHFYVPFQTSSIYSLQQNLAISGIQTAYHCLVPEIIEGSKRLTQKSIVFISTIEHAETMNLDTMFQSIKKQQATVYGLTTRKSKYKDYIDHVILDEDNGKIAEGVLSFSMYFYILSEIYRMKYIEQ